MVREVNSTSYRTIPAPQEAAKNCGNVLSTRSALIKASRSKRGTSTAPDTNGVPCITTGPCSVRYRLSQAGRNQRLRATPARRRVSPRYGNPPIFGRPAIARCCAACKFSIASLMCIFLIPSVYGQSPCDRLQSMTLVASPPETIKETDRADVSPCYCCKQCRLAPTQTLFLSRIKSIAETQPEIDCAVAPLRIERFEHYSARACACAVGQKSPVKLRPILRFATRNRHRMVCPKCTRA
jgi:hypothetical protein